MICGWIINVVKSLLFCFVLFYNAIKLGSMRKVERLGCTLRKVQMRE